MREEDEAVTLLEGRYPNLRYVRTPKDGPASVDAVLMKDGELAGVAETKCRQMTDSTLVNEFGNEWLVTWDKIDRARGIAEGLGVSLYGLLYLVPDSTLVFVRLTNDAGSLVRQVRVRATETQRTVNGGLKVRNNAFISLDGCPRIRGANGPTAARALSLVKP